MKKALLTSLIIILLILIGIYTAGVYFFGIYFLPNTSVNGKDISLTKIVDLEKTYNNIWKDYKVTIEDKSNKKDEMKAIDISYVDKLEPNQKVSQNPFYWFLSPLIEKKIALKCNITYDYSSFLKKVNSLKVLSDKDIVEPKNAKIIYKDNIYTIEAEEEGNKVNKQALITRLIKAFREGENIVNLEKERLYIEPTITKEDPKLKKKLESMNKINSFVITYDFSDRKEELLGEKLLYLYKEENDGSLVADPVRIKNYVGELAAKYDTYRTNRDFNTTDGVKVRIIGGIYGWKTDISKSTDNLMAAMNKMESVTLKPDYSMEAMSRNVNDIGSSYIEIDLARQHMWMYKDGNLVIETDVVTGNPTDGNSTPTGVGKIWSRERNRYLTGADYKSFVNYWLPFNWSGVGIHDSNWRNTYGGDLYKNAGSHGCINTPPQKAKIVFDNTVNGMPVVVYDSSTQKI